MLRQWRVSLPLGENGEGNLPEGLKEKERNMTRCTCNRKKFDLDEDEHLLTCPKILRPEVLRCIGIRLGRATVERKRAR